VSRVERAYQGAGCPRCFSPIPGSVLQQGRVYCGTCALEFTAAAFEPALPRRAPSVPERTSDAAQCARHAHNAAVAACERCGAFMCGLCRVEVEGKALCAACFDRVRADGSLESTRTTFRSWRTLGLHLAILGAMMTPAGILIGPASLFATVRGISQSRKDGDEGGAAGAVLAILLGLFVTAVGIFFLFTMMRVLDAVPAAKAVRRVR